ncbi:hypothetical protein APHAL10511_007656 [Amanita phalloides]|nr:hypothetical protein APHAL10511_007656 [Amanita phalloides]
MAFSHFSIVFGLLFAGRALAIQTEVLATSQIPAAPYFVTYSDMFSPSPPSASEINGFNVFNLGFLLTHKPYDNALSWEQLDTDQQTSIKSQYAGAGIKLLASAFGSTERPTTSGADPIAAANWMGKWVIDNQLDGIDVCYLDYEAFDKRDGSAKDWLISYTQQLRTILPTDRYIVTHAPVAPWFSPGLWNGEGYLVVDSVVGNLINWYNVQFFNQGATEYTTCNGLIVESSSAFPQSAAFQIAANGVLLNKIVIGKPATPNDGHSGYMNTTTLASCLSEAKSFDWSKSRRVLYGSNVNQVMPAAAGVAVWQYPHADPNWITEARSGSWPV